MGYDAYAVAAIGVLHKPGFIKDKIFNKVPIRLCNHKLVDGAFCSVCGKPLQQLIDWPIVGYKVDDESESWLWDYRLVGLDSGNANPQIIAFWVSGSVGEGEIVSKLIIDLDFEGIAAEMRRRLKPLGLWDAGLFGLHVFLDESY